MQRTLESKIKEKWQPSHLEVQNESHMHSSGLGAESHFRVLVVAEAFRGLSRVQRQKLVYELFAQELKNSIHALSLRLLTSEEWSDGAAEGFQSPLCHSKSKISKD